MFLDSFWASLMSEVSPEKIGAILKTSNITWDEDYVCIQPVDSQDIEFIKTALVSLGYSREIDVDVGGISISNAQSAWASSRGLYFYKDKKSLWGDYKSLRVEDYFYITSCGSTNLANDKDEFLVALDSFSNWNKLLEQLADHVGTVSSPDTLIFFVGSEKGAKKYKITPRLSIEQLQADGTGAANETALKLLAILAIDDAQDAERREIMRVALVDFLDDLDSSEKECFSRCLSHHHEFLGKYYESFETLIHRSSINKALEEVAEKNIDYVNKLNDAISGAQTKAFAIPGAIIAIGALVKSLGLAESVLVLFGLWMVKRITNGTNEIQLDVLRNLEYQVGEIFTRYKKASDEAIVKRKAEEAMSSILRMIEKAKKRITNIDKLTSLMLLVAVVYMLARVVIPEIAQWYQSLCFVSCHPAIKTIAIAN